ncbi:MAG: Pr6Pr family membrane protein [Bacteroidota bacterium]
MEKKSFAFEKSLSVICWLTVILQFILLLQTSLVGVVETVLRFFTFFTILTNILVAITFTAIGWQSNSKSSFFLKPNTQTAIAVYIFVVGFVYNTILRFIWEPQGLQRIVDEILHLVIPIVYVLYWFFKVDKGVITWKNCLGWLLYPIVYLIVVMLRGSFSNYYPYPFLDVTKLGIEKVVINSIFMSLFFVLMALIFVGLAKYITRNHNKH